jgi:O-antigen/teichoic acid export membrane protein
MIHSPRLQAEALRRYSGATFLQQLVLSGIFAAALIVTSLMLELRGTKSIPLAEVLAALGFVIVLIASREFIRRVCFTHMQMKTALFVDICVAVIQVVGLALMAWTGHLSASRSYGILGIACAVAIVGWLGNNYKDLDMVPGDVLETAKDNWHLGKWILLSGAVWTLYMNGFPWILNAFHGTAATAVWGACLGVTASSNPVLQGVLNYLGPKLACAYSDGGHESLRRAVAESNKILGAVVLPISVVLIICGGILVQLLYGQRYAGNGMVVAVLALGMAANIAAFSYSRALFTLDYANFDFAINAAVFLVSIGVGVPIVKWLGPLGAAYSFTTINLSGAALRVLAFHTVMAYRAPRVAE